MKTQILLDKASKDHVFDMKSRKEKQLDSFAQEKIRELQEVDRLNAERQIEHETNARKKKENQA